MRFGTMADKVTVGVRIWADADPTGKPRALPAGSPLLLAPCVRKDFPAGEIRPASAESLPWNFGQVNKAGLAKPFPPMPSTSECHGWESSADT